MTRKGVGLACIYKDDLTVEKIKTDKRATFELLSLKIKVASHKKPLALDYRTPYSKNYQFSTNSFIEEFPNLITTLLSDTKNQ